MSRTPPHLKALEEIEREAMPGLVKIIEKEGVEGARYALWDLSGWHRDYSPAAWRSRATAEQKRRGWEIAVRIERILVRALHEAAGWQVEETMEVLSEGPERFYGTHPD